MSLFLVPVSVTDARSFVDQHHRHHPAPQGGLFAIGLGKDKRIVGVAIVGRPVARMLDDSWTAEVTRVAVLEGIKNGCSMLYGACWRAAKALGYRKIITYTLADEPGTSLRAAGWRDVYRTRAQTWHRESRPRVDKHPTQHKIRWEAL